tara:strand:+ start:4564 stop:5550 length:987 start_codon:yes stop_codon:yes gene_type:complete
MIVKFFEIEKKNLTQDKLLLFYGKNEGLKKEIIKKIFKNNEEIFYFEERDILNNQENFLEDIFSQSLFGENKNIIVKRASDKILKIIEEIENKNITDLNIILNSDVLDKKSKLRSFFEKHKKYISVAFYPEEEKTLARLAINFFKEKKITISPYNINLIVNKCSGDREMLFNELEKLNNFTLNNKKLDTEVVTKLINLSENYSINDLINNCLAKNNKKIITILNENNFNDDDSMIILRTFLNKSKVLLKLSEDFKKNKNIDQTILAARPPIFWKDKEIIKQQLLKWSPENIRKLAYEISNVELIIKKNFKNSVNLLNDFILEKSVYEI